MMKELRRVPDAGSRRTVTLALPRRNGEPLKNPPAPRGIGYADVNQLVEAAGTKQRRIDQSRPIGRADHHHVAQLLHPVELGEQEGLERLVDVSLSDPGDVVHAVTEAPAGFDARFSALRRRYRDVLRGRARGCLPR